MQNDSSDHGSYEITYIVMYPGQPVLHRFTDIINTGIKGKRLKAKDFDKAPHSHLHDCPDQRVVSIALSLISELSFEFINIAFPENR